MSRSLAVAVFMVVGFGMTSSAGWAQSRPGQVFRDCADCPEMVVLPAGGFIMGSAESERWHSDEESPPHPVTIKAFALGRHTVTVGEYLSCVAAKACRDPEWVESEKELYSRLGRTLTNRRSPIVGVSWGDTQDYVKWLSDRTGKTYRLPSEAEWEYAARGTRPGKPQTSFWWGNDVGEAELHAWFDNTSGGKLHPVGHPQHKNGFGLYDMVGNVWQWTADCEHPNYEGAPTDGGAWTGPSPSCDRVERGGSWSLRPWMLRSAERSNSDSPDLRHCTLGFRVARTLP